ncbi:MAG: dihydrodipicolinate synthase family protein [Rhodospirillales bacterium]|jgi:4-hydroxy-tetrahydrodipicolinate synthase|nr:dihydrodipicolinate synthase family protein [Rhodospirillales bacterium]
MSRLNFTDVIVATVLPFTEAGAIDWPSYTRLLEYCATPEGIGAVFPNGHAGEGSALSADERIQVIEVTREFVGPDVPLLAGVIAYSTAEAIAQAREAKSAGADVAVLFPLPAFAAGGTRTPAAPLAYVDAVLEGADVPVGIFQFPLASGLGYTTETLVAMAQRPGVLLIKEGSGTVQAYEDNWRQVKAAAPDVAIFPTNFDWFLAQVAIGADGILSGLASLTPHLLIDLWRATEARDLDRMRAVNDTLYPVVRTIYGAPPLMDMHTRIKAGLQHLGIIESARPRPPLLPVSDETAAAVAKVVDGADLARHTARASERRRKRAS